MVRPLPTTTRALVILKSPQGRKPIYHDVAIEERPILPLKKGEVLVKLHAAAFNHRDLWIRKGQYPDIAFGSVLGSDGAGVVIASHENPDELLNKRVFLSPLRGWRDHPDAPESSQGISIVGGTRKLPIGTFAEYVVVERDMVIPTPPHLDDIHAAAWPLGGVTAWRAAIVNARISKGHSVFITGIGGGVALTALQLCVARGANVYVSSSNKDKITRALQLGAKGGVNYKNSDWPQRLQQLLKRDGVAYLDAVIDSGGGDVALQTGKILKAGGRVVCYGMTATPRVFFSMREVLKNQQLIGSTMGSHKDLLDATQFLDERRISPIVTTVLDGLGASEEGFNLLGQGAQFGKIVINIDQAGSLKHKL